MLVSSAWRQKTQVSQLTTNGLAVAISSPACAPPAVVAGAWSAAGFLFMREPTHCFFPLPTHCYWFSTNPLTSVYCSSSATALRLWRPTPWCVAPRSAPSVFPLTQEGSQGSSFSSSPLRWGKVEPREILRARSMIIYIVRLAGSAALKLVLWLGDCIPCAPGGHRVPHSGLFSDLKCQQTVEPESYVMATDPWQTMQSSPRKITSGPTVSEEIFLRRETRNFDHRQNQTWLSGSMGYNARMNWPQMLKMFSGFHVWTEFQA